MTVVSFNIRVLSAQGSRRIWTAVWATIPFLRNVLCFVEVRANELSLLQEGGERGVVTGTTQNMDHEEWHREKPDQTKCPNFTEFNERNNRVAGKLKGDKEGQRMLNVFMQRKCYTPRC